MYVYIYIYREREIMCFTCLNVCGIVVSPPPAASPSRTPLLSFDSLAGLHSEREGNLGDYLICQLTSPIG